MARISKTKKVGNAAPVATGLAAGLPLLAFGPLGAIAGFLIGFGIAKKGIAEDMEEEGADEAADEITAKWLNNRFFGERKISVRREKPMGGLLPISMSVTHTTELHDFEESDARCTDNLAELDDLRRHARPSASERIKRRMYDVLAECDDLVDLAEVRARMEPCSSMRESIDIKLREMIREEDNYITLMRAQSVLDRSPSMQSLIKSRIRSLE